MKQLLLITFLFFSLFCKAQDVTPTDTAYHALPTYSFKYHTTDSSVWIYKGAKYQTTKLASARNVQNKIDSLSNVGYQYWTIGTPDDVVKYGYLYNWYAAKDARGIFSSGFHLPSTAEYEILRSYIGGSSQGAALKEVGNIYWLSIGGTNTTKFNGRGSGLRDEIGFFTSFRQFSYLLTSTEGTGYYAGYVDYMLLESIYPTATMYQLGQKKYGYALRGVKNSTTLTNGQIGSYIGNDGRKYPTICIGTQEWISCNLAETKYANGDLIPIVTGNTAWAALTTSARCVYGNNESNALELGFISQNIYSKDTVTVIGKNGISVSISNDTLNISADTSQIVTPHDLTAYAKLDQSTPQTFINGIPKLSSDRVIDEDHELADKLYVDQVASGGMKSYFFTKNTADISGMYYAVTDFPGGTLKTITGTALDGETLLAEFITPILTQQFRVIDGTRLFYFNAKTSSVTKPCQLKAYTYKCDVGGGSQVLLRTSTLSAPITELDAQYITSSYGESRVIPTTERLIIKIYVVKTGTGLNPTITLNVDDETFGRMDIPSPVGNTDLSKYAIDSLVVHKLGAETIAGAKLFNDAKMGAATNNTTFESDGTEVYNGTATVWDEIQFDLGSLKVLGTVNKPDYDLANLTYDFPQNDTTEIMGGVEELTHWYKTGSSAYFNVHFDQTQSATPVFRVQYKVYNTGSAEPSVWSYLQSNALDKTYTSGTMGNILFFPVLALPGVSMGATIKVKLYRKDNVYTGDCKVTRFGMHLEKDTNGSRTLYAK